MKNIWSRFIPVIAGILFSIQPIISQTEVPTPESYFGFKPGTDYELFNYDEMIGYFQKLDEASDMFSLLKIGESPMGKDMYLAFVSSADNLKNLDRLKEINRQLALNTGLTTSERQKLASDGRVFVYATLSMHAGEVGPSQASPLIAYNLVTSTDVETQKWLDDVVFTFLPSHNPDGMIMVVDHYLKYKGTKYEGSTLPGVYHKYIGHDNNRDFIVLSQSDTKAVASVTSSTWFPQVMVEKHEMGNSSVRYFVPPPHDPVAENIDPGLWNWMKIFGSNMITEMTADSLSGVVQNYIFDDYWPGSTETCLWKNTIAFLTESASPRTATPIYVEPTELRVGGKGLSEYKISINMPDPWPGGWWRLGDVVKYEESSTLAIIKTASLHKEKILMFRNELATSEVEKGKTLAPNYFVLPTKQHDKGELVALVNLLKEHGVKVYQLNNDFNNEDHHFTKGDVVIPLAQPIRAFIKEVLETQTFPLRHYTPEGKIMKPYDITSWSLPLHKGLKSIEVNKYCEKLNSSLELIDGDYAIKSLIPDETKYFAFSANENESYKAGFMAMGMGINVKRTTNDFNWDGELLPKGSFIFERTSKSSAFLDDFAVSPKFLSNIDGIETTDAVLPRIGLVETWFHDMDAGWTRFIFDTYNIRFQVIRPDEIESTNLSGNFDLLIFADAPKEVLLNGKYSKSEYYQPRYPADYTKGMGKKGLVKIMDFVEKGGKVISWARSTDLFQGQLSVTISNEEKEEFSLPFKNIAPALKKKGLYCPGSFVNVNWKEGHPLTLGMQSQSGIFYRGNPVFTTSLPGFGMDRRVIGWFPENDFMLSGYAEKLDLAGNKVSMVWMKKGKGQMIMYAFSPIFRASSPVTYKLLFNALLLGDTN